MTFSSAQPRRRRALAIVLIIAVAGVAILVGMQSGAPSGGRFSPITSSKILCRGQDPSVADPNAPHGLFVLQPPTRPNQPYYGEMLRYVRNNSDVCGADFWVHWSDLDSGPQTNPQYNWSKVDSEIALWAAAGKEVNLIFQAVGYAPNQTYVPSYVLSQVRTLQCGTSAVTPAFWLPPYAQYYQGFMRAAVAHFQTNSAVTYIRFGLGTGGEAFPLLDFQAPGCAAQLNATGFSETVWINYLLSMLDFEKSLNPTVQLMVSLNEIIAGVKDNVSTAVSARASLDGIGIGNQGLSQSSVNYTSSGTAVCGGGWCRYFNQYRGSIPLELQPLGPSSPDGTGRTGSLVPTIPWAIAEHGQIFELYFVDWLVAFDPNYPTYAAYHTQYSGTFDSAAQLLGVAG